MGQVTAQVDALGNRTEYAYDDRGNQVLTRYADGTTEAKANDEEDDKPGQSPFLISFKRQTGTVTVSDQF